MIDALRSRKLLRNSAFDQERFAADMEKPAAHRMFGIFFTPRSGSSWLTDILSQTRHLGKPQEWFNPSFMPDIARAVNAATLEGYVAMLKRKHKPGGFFSFEVTIYQLRRVFDSDSAFLEHFPAGTPFFHLTRDDMVSQAVSLAKAVRTSVFHTANASPEDIVRADDLFQYDGDEIGHWLEHIFDQERACEDFFRRHGLRPHRLSYETITRWGAEETARRFLRILRPVMAPKLDLPAFGSAHVKLGSDRNRLYAERFRAEHPGKIAEIERFRDSRPSHAP